MEKQYHIIFTFRDSENEMNEDTLFKYAKRIGDIIEDEECLDLGSVSCKIQSVGENIDELAKECATKFASANICGGRFIYTPEELESSSSYTEEWMAYTNYKCGFKAGYRKAKEE